MGLITAKEKATVDALRMCNHPQHLSLNRCGVMHIGVGYALLVRL